MPALSSSHNSEDSYPLWTGMIFVFNLIVGTGALTLPSVFSRAGWLLGSVVILLLAFISYMTLTFILETCSCLNALDNYLNRRATESSDDDSDAPAGSSATTTRRQMPAQGEIVSQAVSDHRRRVTEAIESNNSRTEGQSYTIVTTPSGSYSATPAPTHRSTGMFSNDSDDSDNSEEAIPRTTRGETESTPLLVGGDGNSNEPGGYYNLNTKYELGQLARIFFSRTGLVVFYLCMCVYLYGDLSIYNAVVAKSLTDVVCGGIVPNSTNTSFATISPVNETLSTLISTNVSAQELQVPIPSGVHPLDRLWTGEYDPNVECWPGVLRSDFYKYSLIAFVCLLGPFAFFNVTKTKYLQLLTGLFRWLAFAVMIALACLRFFNGQADGHPPVADFSQVPNLFGACIYSFMCHHSLPSLIAPIQRKEKIKFGLGVDYLGISGFYLLLAVTGAFSFNHLSDLYTLNFIPRDADAAGPFSFLKFVEYFLALFPVFTLSASYPIIAITLRNNISVLYKDALDWPLRQWERRVLFPLLAIVPPLIVSIYTANLSSLVRFTGSYAGAGIQYIIPVALVLAARQKVKEVLGRDYVATVKNRFESPFKHGAWLVCVLLWTVVCVALVTMTFQ